MSIAEIDEVPPLRGPLRLWPGVVAAVLLTLLRFGVPAVAPGFEGFRIAVLGGFVGSLAIFVWWAFFSRAPGRERWGTLLGIALALAATSGMNHGSMGFAWLLFLGIPAMSLALVLWAVTTRRLGDAQRLKALAATLLIAGGAWTAVRMDGLAGDHSLELAWRWTPTAEERLLDSVEPPSRAPAPAATSQGTGWPGFRGPGRDGHVPSVRIATDWSQSPPDVIWRRPVGPGWSSFAVHGELLYTQEQRGEDEVVACYHALTGDPVWRHRDAARFYEAMGGAGPRATPTVRDGRVYALGATGILNALDALDGTRIWSRNLATDTGSGVPIWGFSSSPLVHGDVVLVAAGGRLVAYDVASGGPRWSGPDGGQSYSSPHPMTIAGVDQLVLLSDVGATGFAPVGGARLWEHAWAGTSLVQPAVAAGGDLLISAGEGKGIRRIAVEKGSGGWTVEERWESYRLKPNFSDLVVHRGHAYGFDGSLLACIDLEDGARVWKGGRYGHGQLVLLPDQDVLLVLTEQGEVVLVDATADRFAELARFPAIEGKTWNHPVLVGDLLWVRNGQEMAALRLAPMDG